MMKMHKKFLGNTVNNSKGFSLLEVLLGITVFMIGMLGVTALNISSLKSNTFSGNMSEAVILAGDRIEQLMTLDFDDADLLDSDGDGLAGLADTGAAADRSDPDIGKNNMYTVYWNVAQDEPLPEKTKTVNVIVEWSIKDKKRTMNMGTVILEHD
jgi:hypothetical protein